MDRFKILGIRKPVAAATGFLAPSFLADCAGLVDSFYAVASPFDGGDLFVKELETIKRATKFLGTQNLPHD